MFQVDRPKLLYKAVAIIKFERALWPTPKKGRPPTKVTEKDRGRIMAKYYELEAQIGSTEKPRVRKVSAPSLA